jgi:hypothetical protein
VSTKCSEFFRRDPGAPVVHSGIGTRRLASPLGERVSDRDPWPNATQSANWTCTGICAHQSAMRGGDIVRLQPMTKSGLSPAAGPCRGKNFQNRLSGPESRDLSIQLRRCGLRRSVQSWDPCVRFRHRSVSSCKSDPDSLLRVVPLLATFQDDLRVYK